MKINEVAKRSGVTVRTLQYYDRIGLLPPGEVTAAGYRLYHRPQLEQLQQILFFRELDFPLEEIRSILQSPGFDRARALHHHRALLQKKRKRLEDLIVLVDETLKGESNMSFKGFDMQEIEAAKCAYAEEARQHWGSTGAYAQSEARTNSYTKEDWERVNTHANEIMQGFASLHGSEPAGESAQVLVQRWQAFISQSYYSCTDEILAGLGQMYTADERFTKSIDRFGEGTAQLMADAIAAYCENKHS